MRRLIVALLGIPSFSQEQAGIIQKESFISNLGRLPPVQMERAVYRVFNAAVAV
jgi:hypothetical protein